MWCSHLSYSWTITLVGKKRKCNTASMPGLHAILFKAFTQLAAWRVNMSHDLQATIRLMEARFNKLMSFKNHL